MSESERLSYTWQALLTLLARFHWRQEGSVGQLLELLDIHTWTEFQGEIEAMALQLKRAKEAE